MIITFVRGLPGSGKSTFARSIMEKTGAILIEPDMFLTNNYEYRYTPERWEQAKILAQRIVEGIAQRQHADIIYADVLPRINDVDSIVRDLQWYGVKAKYFVWEMPRITREESIARNRHNVRPEDIDQMIRDWEPYPGAIHTSAKDLMEESIREFAPETFIPVTEKSLNARFLECFSHVCLDQGKGAQS